VAALSIFGKGPGFAKNDFPESVVAGGKKVFKKKETNR
jgi:hypothetical protein